MNRFLSVAGYGEWVTYISEFKDVFFEFVRRAKSIDAGTLMMANINEKTDKMKEMRFSQKRFLQWCDEFEGGNVASLILYVSKEYRTIANMEVRLGCALNYQKECQEQKNRDANYFELSFEQEELCDFYTLDEMIDMFKELCIGLSAKTGMIDESKRYFHSTNGNSLPNEAFICRFTGVAPEKHIHEKLRGYFWANLLTSQHIQQLGGWDKVCENVPHTTIQKWIIDGEPAMYLQATERMEEFTDSKRLRLKESLQGVLYEDVIFPHVKFYSDYSGHFLAFNQEDAQKWRMMRKAFEGDPKIISEKISRNYYHGINERGQISPPSNRPMKEAPLTPQTLQKGQEALEEHIRPILLQTAAAAVELQCRAAGEANVKRSVYDTHAVVETDARVWIIERQGQQTTDEQAWDKLLAGKQAGWRIHEQAVPIGMGSIRIAPGERAGSALCHFEADPTVLPFWMQQHGIA